MLFMTRAGVSEAEPDWADPGYFSGRLGRGGSLRRLFKKALPPPDGQRVVPTTAGYMLILVSLGIGTAAYNTASNILFLALSLLLSSLILSGILSWVNFKKVKWVVKAEDTYRAGETAIVKVELSNKKRFLPLYSICFRVHIGNSGEKGSLYLDGRLDAESKTELEWIFQPQKRGCETIRISGIESQFPFGFLRKTVGSGARREVLIYPQRIDYTFSHPVGNEVHSYGDMLLRPGSGAELINIRKYVRGDSQRLIHWKASARQRQLLVRQVAEEMRDGLVILFESPKALWFDETAFECLCSFAVSLAENLFKAGRLSAVAVNDQPILSIKRLVDLYRFIAEIAVIAPTEHYKHQEEVFGSNIITFRPSGEQKVVAYIGGNYAGAAQYR